MTPVRPPLIAENVVKRYGRKAIVDDVSITLAPGEVAALVGPSGAGKSTLLRLFAGLERPESGWIRLGDRVLAGPQCFEPPERRGISLVFQDFALFPHMTAIENAAFGLAHLSRPARRLEAAGWLDKLGLADRADAYPRQLSGGEQQRVAIARALAVRPGAVLMDEPFSGLDPDLRDAVRAKALDAVRAAGAPTLVVTHDAAEAMAISDQLAVMRQGRIVQAGSPNEVYLHPVDAKTAAALGRVNVFGADAPALATLRPEAVLAPGEVIAVRDHDLLVTSESAVKAVASRVVRAGGQAAIEADLCGTPIVLTCAPEAAPAPGDVFGVAIAPGRAMVLPRG